MQDVATHHLSLTLGYSVIILHLAIKPIVTYAILLQHNLLK